MRQISRPAPALLAKRRRCWYTVKCCGGPAAAANRTWEVKALTALWRRSRVWLAAFLLPVALLLGAYALTGIYPFGGKTLLTIDMSNEYVDYYGWYRSLFTGQGSLFYSFGKALGGSMIGLFATYLASPLNLLLLLFRPVDFDTAVLLLTLLKTGLCGMSCAVYLRRSQQASGKAAVLLSVCYALMAYTIVNALNLMWLDGVALLPMVALGVERLLQKGRPGLYIAALTLALFTDFYIGYMIALFSVLFLIYRIFIGEKALREPRFLRRTALRFAVSSAAAGGLSAPLTVPALLSLRTSKERLPLEGMAVSVHTMPLRNYGFFDLLHKFSLGAFGSADSATGLPNVYCGLLVAVLLLLYFWNRCIPAREKLFSALFALLLVLNFYISPLNIVWHGFNPPTWFPYRYSFVLCFLLVSIACRAFSHIRGIGSRHVVAGCAVLLGSLAMFAVFHYADESTEKLALSAGFVAAYSLLLLAAVRRHGGLAGWPVRLLVPVLCAEFILGSHELMGGLSYGSRSEYQTYVRTVSAAAQALRERDGGLYRTEKTFTRPNDMGNPTFNDSLMFGLNGLTHYSSTDDRRVNRLLGQLGYKNNGNWVWYCRGATPVADSLLGVKYLLADDGAEDAYRLAAATGGIALYENPDALPVGFAADAQIRRVTLAGNNPFAAQNTILQAVEPESEAPLSALPAPEITLQNCTAAESGGVTRYQPVSAGREAAVEFRFAAADSRAVYAWFPAASQAGVTVYVNGRDMGRMFDVFHNGVLPLGSFRPGETVTLRFALPTGGAAFGTGEFYAFDSAKLASAAARLRAGGLVIDHCTADRLTGRVQADGSGRVLFLSIPYDTGWTVKIDGRRVGTFPLLGCLTGVSLPAGTHRVELIYRPPGLAAGCAAGAAGVVLAVWAVWLGRRKGSRSASA